MRQAKGRKGSTRDTQIGAVERKEDNRCSLRSGGLIVSWHVEVLTVIGPIIVLRAARHDLPCLCSKPG